MNWEEIEQKAPAKALELVGKVDPAYNIGPVIELVKRAWVMGYDVVPLKAAPRCFQADYDGHQWGQDAEYHWYQSCRCRACQRRTEQIARDQMNAYGYPVSPR